MGVDEALYARGFGKKIHVIQSVGNVVPKPPPKLTAIVGVGASDL